MEYTHKLKTWPEYFNAVEDGKKKFEIRSTEDRKFYYGEHILLEEWDPETKQYSGKWIHVIVTYVTAPDCPFLPENTCVFGFVIVRRGKGNTDE